VRNVRVRVQRDPTKVMATAMMETTTAVASTMVEIAAGKMERVINTNIAKRANA